MSSRATRRNKKGRRLSDGLLAALPPHWTTGQSDSDVTGASLAFHLDLFALTLTALAALSALVGTVCLMAVLAMPVPGSWLAGILRDMGAGAVVAVGLLLAAVLMGGVAVALLPTGPADRGGQGLSRRDAVRLYVLMVSVGPALYGARLIRLFRERGGRRACDFRGCQVQLFDPRVRCGCGRHLPGTWPGHTRPLAVVCPVCGTRHSTLRPLLKAEADKALAIDHVGCPLRGRCRDETELPVIALVGLDHRLLSNFIHDIGQVPDTDIRDLHHALIQERAAPGRDGRPWPSWAPTVRVMIGSPASPPVVDMILFLVPAGIMGGADGLGLTEQDVIDALGPKSAALADRRRPPGWFEQLRSMPAPALRDGNRTVRFAIWTPGSSAVELWRNSSRTLCGPADGQPTP